jgi:hypothetical protein
MCVRERKRDLPPTTTHLMVCIVSEREREGGREG